MIKRYKKQDDRKFYRTNERITAIHLRVLDSEGKQIGVMTKDKALQQARSLELDLVEIAPNANPPVTKIIDFKKFLYQEEKKKKKEEKKKTKASETKEVRLGPFMNDHDLNVMIKRARDFLEDNDKVRFVVKFAGRQIMHPQFGQDILKRALDAIADISKVDRIPHFEGKQLVALVTPERKRTYAKEKDQKIGVETV